MNEPEIIESYCVPIAPDDLKQIVSDLRQRDVFTPTFIASEAERYDPLTYRQQEARFDTSTRLLIDRNILTRWVAIVLGCDEPTPEQRLAAGIMAFALCADALTDTKLDSTRRHGGRTLMLIALPAIYSSMVWVGRLSACWGSPLYRDRVRVCGQGEAGGSTRQVNRFRTELPRMTRIDANGVQGLQSPDSTAPTTRTM